MFTKTLHLHGRLESLYPVPTLEHMSKVNRELEEYLSKGQNLTHIAKDLEILLNSLKNERQNDPVWQEIEKRVNIYLGFTANNLFRRKGKYGWQTGRLFEHEMIGVMQAITDMIFNQPTEKGTFTWSDLNKNSKSKHRTINNIYYTGNIKGTVILDTDFNANDLINDLIIHHKNSDYKTVIQQNIDKDRYKDWASLKVRDIKTDSYGGLSVNIDYESGNKLQRLYSILKKYKCSYKNYADLEKVRFGNSDPFKIYAGVLQTLGYSDSSIRESWLRIQCCYINSVSMGPRAELHKQHQVVAQDTLYKMKTVFELIGTGIKTLSGFEDGVDLIIVNQHNSNTIKVYDALSLAKQLILENRYNRNINQSFQKSAISINFKNR